MIFFLLSFYQLLPQIETRVVRTSYGNIYGSELSNSHHTFKKIPYAQAPLRFQKPQPVEPWGAEIKDGSKYGPACWSNHTKNINGAKKFTKENLSEDCLHLNIFTNERCLNFSNCHVAVYIHGGGFVNNSAIEFNDSLILKNFVDQDVIFITVGYRLGIWSHYTIEDQSIAPTNIAVYDILLALEFIHQEIANFGGDSSKVTLMGHSSGGGLVLFFMFSDFIDPENRLFQKAIAMSPGFEFANYTNTLKLTQEFTRFANCSGVQNSEIEMQCLQNLEPIELLQLQTDFVADHGDALVNFLNEREPFFDGKNMYQYLEKAPKKIPILTGSLRQEMDKLPKTFVSLDFMNFENNVEVRQKIDADLKKGIFSTNHIFDTHVFLAILKKVIDQMSDYGTEVYLYRYNHANHSFHTDDLFFILGVHSFEMDENEKILAEIYPKYFTNFIKTGRPTTDEDWTPYNPAVQNYYEIDYDVAEGGIRPKMMNGFEKEIIDYWFVTLKEFDRNLRSIKMKNGCSNLSVLKFFVTFILLYWFVNL